jgi:hypothetical protein
MTTASMSFVPAERGLARRVLAAGTLVAILDLSYVGVYWVLIRRAITFEHLLQSIATGLLGRAAYDGGTLTALLGGVLHFGIACAWTVLFAGTARRWRPLSRLLTRPRGPVLAGLAYGGFVWLAMDLVVLPLSRARMTPVLSWVFAANFVQHTVMVGLPIALIVGGAVRGGAGAPSRVPTGVVRVRRAR